MFHACLSQEHIDEVKGDALKLNNNLAHNPALPKTHVPLFVL
jgi:hypothetical protein